MREFINSTVNVNNCSWENVDLTDILIIFIYLFILTGVKGILAMNVCGNIIGLLAKEI